MTKLTETQTTIITAACSRPDGFLARPEALNRTAAVKVAAKLLDQNLVQEVPAKLGWPIWRIDEDGRAFSLKILKAGRAVIQAPSEAPKIAANMMVETPRSSPKPQPQTEALPNQVLSAIGQASKSRSKREVILGLLQRQGGATIGDLMAATGWLPHSTRAALTGLRKTGLAIARSQHPEDQTSVYRIVPANAAEAA